jgi:hypothetical protein
MTIIRRSSRSGVVAVLAVALLAVSCNKAPTDPASAAKEAVRLYPALGLKDSAFNQTYLKLHREAAQKEPALLQQPDWPLTLAHRTARVLGVLPIDATPPPGERADTNPPPSESAPTPPWNPLDKDPWKEGKRVVKGTPWRRY